MTLKKNDFIKVAKDNWHFTSSLDESIFVPIGCNYFPRGTGWAPKIWVRFNEQDYIRDFERMAKLGMNVPVVFLSLAVFMPKAGKLCEETMGKCQKMLDIASEFGIRVIFSGPSGWDGTPEWARILGEDWSEYFTDPYFLDNLSYFWENFGKAFGTHEAIFSYDLFNEPYIKWETPSRLNMWREYLDRKYGSSQTEWGREIPDPNDGQTDKIWEYQQFKDSICKNFIKVCVDAIRKNDTNHMVSIGCHPSTVPFENGYPGSYFGFNPHTTSKMLDYVSLHWYPYFDDMEISDGGVNFNKNMALLMSALRFMHAGKPLILEEFGLYGGGKGPDFPWRKPFSYISQEMQADWVLGVILKSRGFCSGWLNWGFDDHPDWGDVTRYQGLFDDDGNVKELGRKFPSVAAETSKWVCENSRQNADQKIRLVLKEILTDKEKAEKFKMQLIGQFLLSDSFDFDVVI